MERSASSILIAHMLAIFVFEKVKGQHTIGNVTMTEMFFTSPGYIDGLNYGNNMTRDYSFYTNYAGHNLQLTVVEFQLEDGDKNGDCFYDKVIVYDGNNESAAVLTELCGTILPGTVYNTSNNTVYVVFSSDDSNRYKGFNISIVSDGPIPTTTPPSTTETSTTSPTVSSSKTSESSSVTDHFTTDESAEDNGYIVWVIVASCLAGFLLLVICVVVITRCLKKANRAKTNTVKVIRPIQAAHPSDHVAKSSYQNKSKTRQDITASAGKSPEA